MNTISIPEWMLPPTESPMEVLKNIINPKTTDIMSKPEKEYPVIVYDRYRFAIPLKARLLELKEDRVKVVLEESNNHNYPIGEELWLFEEQVRNADTPGSAKLRSEKQKSSGSDKSIDEILSMPPKKRIRESTGDTITNEIWGILIGFAHMYEHRDKHIDIITLKQAEKEIRQLLSDHKKDGPTVVKARKCTHVLTGGGWKHKIYMNEGYCYSTKGDLEYQWKFGNWAFARVMQEIDERFNKARL